ncbi:MAG: sulfurtransferase [Anaerolineae bacterium]|nr:MAG: sulfurtransferase [Anaerolineae bacterium]
MIPEISVQELAKKFEQGEEFTLLDVREAWEVRLAAIRDERVLVLPMSVLAQKLQEAFPAELRRPDAPVIVMCHHGIRSAQVTAWMRQNGWNNVYSLAGGIDAYARSVDASVGYY